MERNPCREDRLPRSSSQAHRRRILTPAEYESRLRALFSAEKAGAARRLAAVFVKNYPDNIQARYCYAVSLSESTAGLSKIKAAQNRRRTVAILKRLLKDRSRLPLERALGVENEYYWFSDQPKKQYELGRWMLAKHRMARANYCCGVGAAMMTLRAARNGDAPAIRTWFKRAQAAWKNYHREFEERIGSVIFEAVAWGASGDSAMMEKRLNRCRELAKIPARNHSILWARREVRLATENGRRRAR